LTIDQLFRNTEYEYKYITANDRYCL